MSDFDDEPEVAEGDGANDAAPTSQRADDAAPKGQRRRPEPDDDWDDDWDDDDDRGGRRDLTLVYAVVAAAVVIVLAIVLTSGKDEDADPVAQTPGGEVAQPNKNWQGAVGEDLGENGEGNVLARIDEDGPGVYIYTGFTGWHVRSSLDAPIQVTVTAPKVGLKPAGGGDVSEFAETVTFDVPAGDGSQDFGFDVSDSETVTVEVRSGGELIEFAQIRLGGKDGVATENPVTFTKA